MVVTHWWRPMSLCCHHSTRCCRALMAAVQISSCAQRSLLKTVGLWLRGVELRERKKHRQQKTWINREADVTSWNPLRVSKTQDVIGGFWSKATGDLQSIPDNTVNRYSIKERRLNCKLSVLFWKKCASWTKRFPWTNSSTSAWSITAYWCTNFKYQIKKLLILLTCSVKNTHMGQSQIQCVRCCNHVSHPPG